MQLTDGENLHTMVLHSPIGICVLDAGTLVAEIVNAKFLEVAGKPYEAIHGRFYWDAFAEARPYYEAALAGVVRTGEAYEADEVELMLIRHGREENIFVTFVYAPVKNAAGSVVKIAVWVLENTRQVTERQKVEAAKAALQQERDRLQSFFMKAPAGICILGGTDLVYELVNPLYQQLFPGRDLLGKPLLEAVPEVKGAPIWDVLQEVYRSGKTFEGNELLIPLARTADGPVEDRYFNFIYQARQDETGKTDGIIVFVIEVTGMIHIQRDQLAMNDQLSAANEELASSNEELTATQSESRRLLEQVEASESRFRFILDAMPQQVWTATPDGALNYVNQVVCNDFGYNLEEIVGHGWQAFIHPDDLDGCMAKWRRSLETGVEYVVEFRLKFSDGNYRWHLARALPFAENNKVVLWLGTNTNIEQQKLNEERKDEFLSIASHELKTPLTSIKAYNQIIQRITDPEKTRPFILKSADHIHRLERLIGDLLDVTKINAGKMNYIFEPISFKQLLEDSVESARHGVASHELILESAPELTYTGDHLRLEQVMHNFLSNAVKYSPGGKKVIVNSYIDHDNIVVSVQDFGIGIPRENLDKLFDRYYRIDNTAMRFEGLGLGLFISAEILRKHNGSFWIESGEGNGSTFYFRLPLAENGKLEITRTATFYRDKHITINYNQTHRRLDVNWTGFQDLASVQSGCMLMLEYLENNQTDRVVNDNTHVLGNWSEATDWVGNTWFPLMEQAGMKYFAHIFSPSTFSQLSAKKSIDIMAGIITTQYFTDVALAEQWVDAQKAR
jgi:PAS domain S-box-containing protein